MRKLVGNINNLTLGNSINKLLELNQKKYDFLEKKMLDKKYKQIFNIKFGSFRYIRYLH